MKYYRYKISKELQEAIDKYKKSLPFYTRIGTTIYLHEDILQWERLLEDTLTSSMKLSYYYAYSYVLYYSYSIPNNNTYILTHHAHTPYIHVYTSYTCLLYTLPV